VTWWWRCLREGVGEQLVTFFRPLSSLCLFEQVKNELLTIAHPLLHSSCWQAWSLRGFWDFVSW